MVNIKTTSVRDKEQEDEELFMLGNTNTGDDEEDGEEEEEDDQQEASHAQLLSNIMKLTKKGKMQQEVRTSLSTSTVDTSHLLSRLGPSTALKKDKHSHTLPLPVEKTVARRIKRAAGYENVAMEVNKWAKVVKVRREAEQLHFPLERNDLSLKTVEKTDVMQMRTPLEQEVYSLLQGAKLVQNKKETEEEEVARKALSLQQIKERNRELWHQKEMKRRYEQKARLMNKSKSRKHHRLLRRERLRKQKAELEELQKTDPEAALERLQELEAVRIEERMSLRHKTSKWAHLQGFRATRDKNAMAALRENQRMHEQLTAKTAKPQESEEENLSDDAPVTDQDEREAVARGTEESLNPWTRQHQWSKNSKDFAEDESFTKFKKFWEEVNRRKQADQEIEEQLEKEKEKKEMEDAKVEEENGSEGEKEEEEEEEEEEGKKDDELEEEQKQTQEEEEEEEEEVSKRSKKKPQKSKEKILEMKHRKNESECNGEKNKKKNSKKKKKKQTKPLESCDQEAVSIDKLFDEVETGIKNKVMKKLKKLGVDSKEPWKEVKAKRKNKKTVKTITPSEIDEFDFTSTHNQENTDETMKRVKTLQDLECIEGKSVDKVQEAVRVLKDSKAPGGTGGPHNPKLQVDPNKFLQVEAKQLVTAMPDSVGEAGEALDDEEENEETAEDIIREAFADDYLMEEFSSEKAEAIKKDQVGTSLALPGWGDWTGPNMKMSNRKIKKFRLRVPQARRKDSQLGHVLYNETSDVHSKLRKAMVTELPYPFKSVKDFEASVRAPVGQLFVPAGAHKRLTAPPVVTKMGTVIQPMTEDELLRQEGTSRGTGNGGNAQGAVGGRNSTSSGQSRRKKPRR